MIKIIYGPASQFEKIIPNENKCTTLTKLLYDIDSRNRHLKIINGEEVRTAEEKICIDNLVISTEEYARLSESGINGFITILNQADIKNMFFQNPPDIIYTQLKRAFDDIKEERHKYKKVNENNIKEFNKEFSKKILGQDSCKNKLLHCLYKIAKGYNKNKPLVLLLYGPAGVGKTETAKFLCKILKEKLFRKQFSMYQNYSFADYVFGSSHSSSSLARDLLDRESNIILFDEFDKPSNLFYSAFYQMFDEGVFVDKNYKVDLQNSIILCTSNFRSLSDIRESLGEPIFTRIDSFIEYKELSEDVSKQLIEIKFDNVYNMLSKDDKSLINREKDLPKLISSSKNLKNAREIDRVIEEFVFARIINQKFIT